MIHSFLLIGQSNAAGRGYYHEAEPLDNLDGRLKVARNGLWVGMFRPINPDRSFSGTCLAESFAKAYALEHEDVSVGIIPCADGGTQLAQWQPGEVLFDNAVHCARLAMRSSSLKGVLWHQGESDCREGRYVYYDERFRRMAEALREALGMPELPILVGGLGDYLPKRTVAPALGENYEKVNAILKGLGESYPHCAYVTAEGLSANEDNLHFSAAALKEFGLRYYEKYRAFDKTESEKASELEASERSAMELL